MGCRGLERAPGGETDMRGTDDFRLTGGRVYMLSRRSVCDTAVQKEWMHQCEQGCVLCRHHECGCLTGFKLEW